MVTMTRAMKTICAAAGGLFLLAGCATSQHATGDTQVRQTADGRVVVEVKLDEYKIHMPTTVPAGAITLHIENTGEHRHNIRIAGHGVDATVDHDLEPGEAADIAVTLEPGEYRVTCPVGPHARLGMRLTLTATES